MGGHGGAERRPADHTRRKSAAFVRRADLCRRQTGVRSVDFSYRGETPHRAVIGAETQAQVFTSANLCLVLQSVTTASRLPEKIIEWMRVGHHAQICRNTPGRSRRSAPGF